MECSKQHYLVDMNVKLGIKIMIITILCRLQVVSITSSVPSFAPLNQIFQAGTIMPIQTLSSSNTSITPVLVTFLLPLTVTYPLIQSICSISSFNALSSNQLSFNITISNFTYTSLIINVNVIGNTYFNMMKVNYMAYAYYLVWNTEYLFYSNCYLCSSLLTGEVDRTQLFMKQNLTINIINPTIYSTQSMISGMKFLNNRDISKKVSVKSYITNNTNYITHEVTVSGSTGLDWICLSTIVTKQDIHLYSDRYYWVEKGQFTLDSSSNSIVMSQFPSNYSVNYIGASTKFFGFSEIQVVLGKTYQMMDFKSDLPTQVQLNYDSIKAGGILQYYFFTIRQCGTVGVIMYSIMDNLCYSACPTNQYALRQACFLCHYSCAECSAAAFNNCTSCDPAVNRQSPLANNICTCKAGFVDIGVPLCAVCNNYIPNCDVCISTTICGTCSANYNWNSTTLNCTCTGGKFYIVNPGACATYPGCTQATIFTNAVICKSCDANLNFVLFNSTCKCIPFSTISYDRCVDKCGDGVNLVDNSTLYCDDGNNVTGDGCSNTCKVETGYGCFNPQKMNRSYCSPNAQFTINYLYAERIMNENAGIFVFKVTPADARLALSSFKFYIQSSIGGQSSTSSYDLSTSQLSIKISYISSIQSVAHSIKITPSPYIVSSPSISLSISPYGCNYPLTIQSSSQLNLIFFYGFLAISCITLALFMALVYLNKKTTAIQVLLPMQVLYFGTIMLTNTNVWNSSFVGLKYLTGFNDIYPFKITNANNRVQQLSSNSIFAQFLLNFNVMGIILAVIIVAIIPLKIHIQARILRRKNFSSSQVKKKLIDQDSQQGGNVVQPVGGPVLSLRQLSLDIKWAQALLITFIDRVYFGISIILLMPILSYFCLQLGYIGRIGSYQLSTVGNIVCSIGFLMLDFCFVILVFQDTQSKDKMFTFGKKMKDYPYRLILGYFAGIATIMLLLLTGYALYGLLAFMLGLILFVIIQNPYEKASLDYVDCIAKPLVTLICLCCAKAITILGSYRMIFVIAVLGLLLTSLSFSIFKVVRQRILLSKKKKQIQLDHSIQQESEVNQKQFKQDQTPSEKSKINRKLRQYGQKLTNQQKPSNNSGDGLLNQNDQSALALVRFNKQNIQQNNQQQDQLDRIKRDLRKDLKKRRGLIQNLKQDHKEILPTKQTKQQTIQNRQDAHKQVKQNDKQKKNKKKRKNSILT